MLNLLNHVALGVILGLLFSFMLAWFSADKGDTAKQTTCKLFLGVLIFNLIFLVLFRSTGLVVGFSMASALLCAKMFPKTEMSKKIQKIHVI